MPYPADILINLYKVQFKPAADKWPGGIWATEQAFKDARTFLLNLNPIKILPPNYWNCRRWGS